MTAPININQNKAQTESQKQMILEHLLTGCSITTLEALMWFNCMKASNRVSELKDQGWPIQTKIIDTDSHKRVAQYRLY